MNAVGSLPWKLTFSYGRALQAAALKAWGGKTGAFSLEQVRAGIDKDLAPAGMPGGGPMMIPAPPPL